MDRTEAQGLGFAVAGHAALLALMAIAVGQTGGPPLVPDSMEVSFVEDIGRFSAAPVPSSEPPAPAAPAASTPTAEPEPTPPEPRPPVQPTQPTKQTVRRPPPPTETRSQSRRQNNGPLVNLDNLPDDRSTGSTRSPSQSNRNQARMTGQAAANIAQAIARQVQPCADRQVYPGPGAERIVTTIRLRLKPNGSLAAPPQVLRQSGTDLQNGRYARRVADLAVRSFVECSPLRGLPAELYDVQGGWSNFDMNYRMPG